MGSWTLLCHGDSVTESQEAGGRVTCSGNCGEFVGTKVLAMRMCGGGQGAEEQRDRVTGVKGPLGPVRVLDSRPKHSQFYC